MPREGEAKELQKCTPEKCTPGTARIQGPTIMGLKAGGESILNTKLPEPRSFLHPIPSGYHCGSPLEGCSVEILNQTLQTLSGHAVIRPWQTFSGKGYISKCHSSLAIYLIIQAVTPKLLVSPLVDCDQCLTQPCAISFFDIL